MASADAGRLVKMMAVIDADTEVVEVEVCCEADTECCDSKKTLRLDEADESQTSLHRGSLL